MTHTIRLAAAAMLLVLCVPLSPAEAQYFGRNKVQWERFEFAILQTTHFDIYHYPAERAAAQEAGRLAERWYARFTSVLGRALTGRQPLILYADHPSFQQTTAISGQLGVGTGGVTESLKRRIVMPFAGPLSGTDHVLGHELVHAFQYEALGAQGSTGGSIPLWFIEGMAEYLSIGPSDAQTAMWLRDALARDDLPSISDLQSPNYFPYRFGHAFWAYVAGRWGPGAVDAVFLSAAGRGASMADAFSGVLGIDEETLSDDWHRAIARAYQPVLQRTTQEPADGAQAVIEPEREGGLNVGPALSPDGRRLMFLSERSQFSIDLYLADAQTGEVTRSLLETATDPHFDNLQFIESAGAWSPEGDRFALTAVREGDPVLVLLDVEGNDREEIPFPALGEITTPAWSPDGRYVAFSANVGGFLDLFVYDLQAGELRRLTDDPYADMQPDWSPDGRWLAFATDRFTSELSTLDFGAMRLALVDARSGDIQQVPAFQSGRQINPRWASDGESVYFLADPDGIANVYRVWPADGRLRRLTNVTTGVAGITDLSPALTAARATDAIAFSVFRAGGFVIRRMDGSALDGTAVDAGPAQAGLSAEDVTMLPSEERRDSQYAAVIDSPRQGLPSAQAFPIAQYGGGLSLDYVGAPYLVAGADAFGTFVGGGITFLFSDMLGRHTLTTQVQVNGEFEDVAGQASYLNQSRRWHWGVTGGQFPSVSAVARSGRVEVDGETLFAEQQERFRQTERSLAGVVSYPFSRSRRVEFTGGVRQFGFGRELRTQLYVPSTRQLVDETERALDAPEGFSLLQTSAAFVTDTSRFGATSPVLGRRSRLEVSPWFGEVSLVNVLADYRQYVMPARPWTLAGRILHYGRYGTGADDERLSPLFLGYPNFVRGYEVNSFGQRDCGLTTEDGRCPAFERLVGNRLLVGNLELRVPLVGAFTGNVDYGPLPIELFAFTDAGVAWTAGEPPAFAGGDRGLVRSVGGGARINVFGALIAEFHAVRALDRVRDDWAFGFRLTPGF